MLIANIAFQLLPILNGITHLREESGFVFARLMLCVERVIAQLPRIDPGVLNVRQEIRHNMIIAHLS